MTGPVSVDPYASVRAAGVDVEIVPAVTIQPDPTPEIPHPPPIVIPERVSFIPNLAALPDVLKGTDGQLAVPTAVAVLWGIFHAMEIRTVTGRRTLTATPVSPVWSSGLSADLAITWDQVPPIVPTGVVVSIEAGVAWMGKTTAVVKAGTVTATGCTVTVKNVGAGAVVPSSGQPVTYTASALYLFTPPLTT